MSLEKKIYRLNDKVYFRMCDYDDCTDRATHWKTHEKCISDPFSIAQCPHDGSIHLHCPQHNEFEMVPSQDGVGPRSFGLSCAACGDGQRLGRMLLQDIETIKRQAKSALNSNLFKGAKLVRLDDFYYPEVSEKSITKKSSDFWVSYDVKKTKEGKPLLVLYLGDRRDNSKVQFFIDPETGKVSHDHKDTDPLSVITKVEVEFKNGTIEIKNKDSEETKNDNPI